MNAPPRRRPPSRQQSQVRRWLPAIAAVSVLTVVVIAGAFGDGKHDASGVNAGDLDGTQGVTTSSLPAVAVTDDGTSYDVTGLTVPPSTLPDPNASTIVPLNKTTLARTLRQGTFGDDVKMVQSRLTELGFVPGKIDGAYGEQTLEAVWAYEKLILQTPFNKATGKVTNEMWLGMQDPVVVQPRRPGAGTHVEIYLPQQVAAVFTDNKATMVLHISSGTAMTPERTKENSWCETIHLDTDENGNVLDPPEEKAVCGVAYTPGGVFRFQRQVQGDRVGALGRMFNPVYFNFGIAMHGAKKVPLTPASHGCIRMNQTISNTFQSFVHLRDRVYVWGWDGKEPEQYSKRESTPIFNYADPDATTTTSTTIKPTTTTAKASTTVTTTKPGSTPTTSKPAPTTTTTKSSPTTTTPAATTTPSTAAATVPPTTISG